MSIHAHIKELRLRLFLVAIIFVIGSVIAYTFSDELFGFLTKPLEGESLYNTTVGGQFSFILQITLWCGAAVTLPFMILAVYGFIAPVLPSHTKKKSVFVFLTSLLLFIGGAAFGYFYAMPGAMRFLLDFSDGKIISIITGDSYLSFLLVYTIGAGMLFQIPLLMIITNWMTPLKPMRLLRFERYVIVVAFIVAALITPTPDPLNQIIIAAPVIAMYQVGVIAVAFSSYYRKRAMRSGVVNAAPQLTATTHRAQHVKSVANASVTFEPVLHIATPSKQRRSIDGVLRHANGHTHIARPTVVSKHISLKNSHSQPNTQQRRSIDGISYQPSLRAV